MQYLGSKRRIAKNILPIILQGRAPEQCFVDLFCGGCNLIDKVAGTRIANDLNHYLIALWKALSAGWDPPEIVTEELYKSVKEYPFLYPDELVAFVGFCCSFGSKWFGGYGRRHKPHLFGSSLASENRRGLLKQIGELKDVKFLSLSYDKVAIPGNSVVYCDPPYKGTTEYKNKGFDHDIFWTYCRDMITEGHRVFVSEYTAPDDFFSVWSCELSTNMDAKKIVKSKEKLFIHASQLPDFYK